MHSIWLDCDPGHDDMLAIIMAALHPSSHLIGISTSAGNSTVQNTTQNALNILEQINKNEISVYKGSPQPLCGELCLAPEIHGASGLEGAQLKKSTKEAIEENSLLKIYQKICQHEGKVNFVVTGTMTNLALILKTFPNIKQKLETATIMGGAIGMGNWTPAAQFNILGDPEAAYIVFNSGIKINMIPIELTHQVEIRQPIFEELKAYPSVFSDKLYDLFRYFQIKYKQNQNFDYPLAHDPCTIYYILNPHHFEGRDAFVEIQLQGKSRGRTNCSFMHFKKQPNAFICEKMNLNQFWITMMNCIKMIK